MYRVTRVRPGPRKGPDVQQVVWSGRSRDTADREFRAALRNVGPTEIVQLQQLSPREHQRRAVRLSGPGSVEWTSLASYHGRMGGAKSRDHGDISAIKRYAVERIWLNSGGYDRRGRYFGTGAPLYSVTDNETGKETEVRASSAKAARKKVIEGVSGPAPVNKLHGASRALSKKLYEQVWNEAITAPQVEKLRAEVVALAAQVRPLTISDRAWPYYDKEMVAAADELEQHRAGYAVRKLHAASQMVDGAASRMKA
jgi:hypothetical protein